LTNSPYSRRCSQSCFTTDESQIANWNSCGRRNHFERKTNLRRN
jgi:hypothetical protein